MKWRVFIRLDIMGYEHGIIKVRKWIPYIAYIRFLPKVIPSKLFLGMVPIS